MTTQTQGKITLKLFAGFLVNSELRMHLRASPEWKEYQIIKTEHNLKLVHFEDKDYLGFYLEPAQISLKDVSSLEIKISEMIKNLFPKYSQEELPFYLFSQSFIH